MMKVEGQGRPRWKWWRMTANASLSPHIHRAGNGGTQVTQIDLENSHKIVCCCCCVVIFKAFRDFICFSSLWFKSKTNRISWLCYTLFHRNLSKIISLDTAVKFSFFHNFLTLSFRHWNIIVEEHIQHIVTSCLLSITNQCHQSSTVILTLNINLCLLHHEIVWR